MTFAKDEATTTAAATTKCGLLLDAESFGWYGSSLRNSALTETAACRLKDLLRRLESTGGMKSWPQTDRPTGGNFRCMGTGYYIGLGTRYFKGGMIVWGSLDG